jgi:hypothetical protein
MSIVFHIASFVIGLVIGFLSFMIIQKEKMDENLAICQIQMLHELQYYISDVTLESIITEMDLNEMKYYKLAHDEGIVDIANLIKKVVTGRVG